MANGFSLIWWAPYIRRHFVICGVAAECWRDNVAMLKNLHNKEIVWDTTFLPDQSSLLYSPAANTVNLTSGVRGGIHVTAEDAKAGRKADQEEPDEGASGASGACAPGTKPDAKAEEKLDELAGLVNLSCRHKWRETSRERKRPLVKNRDGSECSSKSPKCSNK
ncbi:hypothetical protein GBF38_002361 [Nibea albiflora]|uniref:Uncharacterized protein n=1 Tax=Nibea albiflora TaxID=240163 RepID=A0ACB7EDR1_NIBAL|nr:hypothetical protein GBF38_002361 [Nibea albiflora]